MGIAERKAREFKRREEEILTAAYALFMEHGLEAVTIEMISDAAEIGKGTVYKHFTSKQDIFASLSIASGEEMIRTAKERIAPDSPVLDQIKTLIRMVWDNFMADPEGYYLLNKCERILTMDNVSPELAEKIQKKHNYFMELAERLFQRGIKEGILRDAPIDHLFLVSYGLISGTIDAMRDREIDNPEQLYQLMESIAIRGIMRY